MKKIVLLLFLFLLRAVPALAQEIAGRVLDDKGAPLPNAAVQVYKNGLTRGGCTADDDGNYTIKPLDLGKYNVLACFMGYDTTLVEGVIVGAGKRTRLYIPFSKPNGTESPRLIITYYKKPISDIDLSPKDDTIHREILTVPARNEY